LTGTAVMRLVDSGQLNLDQPIRTYIPWIALGESGAADIITLRMLMSHTSGLGTAVEQHSSRAPSGLVTFIRE
jgi:CubicO group peptidase (beta-lactamase class C family)